jgi:hypothetical protein
MLDNECGKANSDRAKTMSCEVTTPQEEYKPTFITQ